MASQHRRIGASSSAAGASPSSPATFSDTTGGSGGSLPISSLPSSSPSSSSSSTSSAPSTPIEVKQHYHSPYVVVSQTTSRWSTLHNHSGSGLSSSSSGTTATCRCMTLVALVVASVLAVLLLPPPFSPFYSSKSGTSSTNYIYNSEPDEYYSRDLGGNTKKGNSFAYSILRQRRQQRLQQNDRKRGGLGVDSSTPFREEEEEEGVVEEEEEIEEDRSGPMSEVTDEPDSATPLPPPATPETVPKAKRKTVPRPSRSPTPTPSPTPTAVPPSSSLPPPPPPPVSSSSSSTLELKFDGFKSTVTSRIEELLEAPTTGSSSSTTTGKHNAAPPLPTTCFPALTTTSTFDTSFAHRAQSLPPLSYEDALAGLHTTQVWASAKLAFATETAQQTDNTIVSRSRYASRSLATYCMLSSKFRPDHVPAGGCPGEDPSSSSTPTFNYPWCFPPSDPIHVMSVDCGIVENYIVHDDIAFTIFTENVVVATDRDRWKVVPNVHVTEYEELACMGAAEYPTEPGHFPNENLHALLALDAFLPERIPLLWPNGGIASHFLESLREEGVLNPKRQIIPIGTRHAQSYQRAKRLYFFRSNRAWGQSPFISWYGQRLVQQRILPILERRIATTTSTTSNNNKDAHKHAVVVLQRHGARTLTNHNELMSRLKHLLPDATFDSFVPGPGEGHPMWDTAERIYKSCLLIGPHGGNMPNEMFLRPGCWVVEIGFMDPGFALPTDFYCYARNLGLSYWMSLGEGSYGSALTANIDDIAEIIEAYKKEVLGGT